MSHLSVVCPFCGFVLSEGTGYAIEVVCGPCWKGLKAAREAQKQVDDYVDDPTRGFKL